MISLPKITEQDASTLFAPHTVIRLSESELENLFAVQDEELLSAAASCQTNQVFPVAFNQNNTTFSLWYFINFKITNRHGQALVKEKLMFVFEKKYILGLDLVDASLRLLYCIPKTEIFCQFTTTADLVVYLPHRKQYKCSQVWKDREPEPTSLVVALKRGGLRPWLPLEDYLCPESSVQFFQIRDRLFFMPGLSCYGQFEREIFILNSAYLILLKEE